MSIVRFENEIFVHHSPAINPASSNHYYAKLVGYNPETHNFVFDFVTPVFTSQGTLKGEHETVYVIDARAFHLIGHYKDNLLGILQLMKSVGMLYKIHNISSELLRELNKEELEREAVTLEEFLVILNKINSGEQEVEVEEIKDEEWNNDPEEGNVMPNLNGQFFIKQGEDQPLSGMACDLLIGSDGHPNYSNMRVLKDAGFNVFATEKDSFGWLGGAVRTKKGLIFFG